MLLHIGGYYQTPLGATNANMANTTKYEVLLQSLVCDECERK